MAHSSLTRAALILTVTPASAVVATPLTTYGYVGSSQNMWTGSDSGAQGMAWAYSKDWVFHAIQIGAVAPSGYSISIYGSNDPRIFVPDYAYDRNFSGGASAGLNGSSTYGRLDSVTATGRDGALRLPIAQHVQNGDVSLNPNSWVLMPSPSDQAGTGIDVNPIISVGQMFYTKRPLLAVRVVLTASAAAVGSLGIVVCAV